MQQQTGLSGMNEIAGYMRRSAVTILKLIRTQDFPAVKVGGVWESDKGLIDQWRREQITGAVKQNDVKAMQ